MLVMPSEADLPDGPRREFVAELFVHYREANRPTLRQVSEWITANADERNLRGTASTETVRRVMNGSVVPRNWATVEAILEALCALADRSTDEDRWEHNYGYGYGGNDPSPTFKQQLNRLWNAALDHPDGELPRLPARAAPPPPPRADTDDPWATGPARYSPTDDPPF